MYKKIFINMKNDEHLPVFGIYPLYSVGVQPT